MKDRPGLLKQADGGVLFLDEIGELGLDEQAMLLRALEEHRFLPVGADRESRSEFQLLAGTNRDLHARVAQGLFREDLLARIDTWTFRLPGLAERSEDIAPNLEYELETVSTQLGRRITFNAEARQRFLAYATTAPWPGNFRDFHASIVRMATLAPGGRIDAATVTEELGRSQPAPSSNDLVTELLGPHASKLDRFDRVQLADVLRVCRESRSLSAAGRTLFAASRADKENPNDARSPAQVPRASRPRLERSTP